MCGSGPLCGLCEPAHARAGQEGCIYCPPQDVTVPVAVIAALLALLVFCTSLKSLTERGEGMFGSETDDEVSGR